MRTKFVTVKSPESDETVQVSELAFEKVWKDKGYTKVDTQPKQGRSLAEPDTQPRVGAPPAPQKSDKTTSDK